MGADSDSDDGFDWEAAVAAMENISLLANKGKHQDTKNVLQEHTNKNEKETRKGARAGANHANGKVHQTTLLGFVQRYNQQPESERPKNEYADGASGCFVETDGPCSIDPLSVKTWVYPVNVPMRDYQFSIVQTALFSNTLVSLPTGLGKTLIAAVVMYNFFRWFPTGKIIFTAPSRPLVLQQIEACHNIVGISQEWTIDMTGQMSPVQRSDFWQAKRVFFVTPQVLEKDIHSGSCPTQNLVCLVVDEAHRAMGNYSYCVVVRKLMEASVRLRILALTATPGSKQGTIQAVLDNLHISCMEYRNESDPDVRQYVHDRKIELLQVAMDAESMKIKDLFLEILQPLVNRLCGFGVFYSRDAARLAPYEFLTARDKFRQAPPSALDQRQFGEVEACFGAVITLYHIFKLLFSHGIRPAFEMLKQKLQSGPFARLMGRNERLQQIKLLMQQHVGNGASSPKLQKMQELITDHFNMHEPAKTRVIIFTNFRESVKDILEALRTVGDTVKAMEFIGQSSGKFSKGQSQKVQQSVLQKFRSGGYNTIVATSIAEEGLDIMEVDLVICFDANISPLRMIQRMGRTGRKRDGRVVVLASEGAEFQGYLKKQAKSKILGKRMYNGGVNSFNFHSSPRMVPHSVKPEVQLVELSIEKFVPRVKNKQNPMETWDPGTADLTGEELLTLRKYIEPSQPATWKPSLIAFPHCQLLPTRVHKIRHSGKTISMLIDTLQSLQDHKVRNKFNSSEDATFMEENVVEGSENVQELVPMQAEGCSEHADDGFSSPRASLPFMVQPELPGMVGNSSEKQGFCGSPLLYDEQRKQSTDGVPSQSLPIKLKDSQTFAYLSGSDSKYIEISEQSTSLDASHGQKLDDGIAPQSVPTKLEDCRIFTHSVTHSGMLSQGFISVDSAGYVQITSPHMLPYKGALHCLYDDTAYTRSIDDNSKVKLFEFGIEISPSSIVKDAHKGLDREGDLLLSVKANGNMVSELGSTPMHGPGYYVASTPEDKILKGFMDNGHELHTDSPRLSTLAEQGVVPLSPGLEGSFIPKEQGLVRSIGFIHCATFHGVPKENVTAKQPQRLPSGEKVKQLFGMTLSPSVSRGVTFKKGDFGTAELHMTTTGKENNMFLNGEDVFSKILGNAESGMDIALNNEQTAQSPAGLTTPLLQQSSKSSSGNWKLSMDITCSIHKPQKFKRLRKAQDKQKIEALKPCSSQKGRQRGKAKSSLLGKQKRKIVAAMLIDEEAEVSSDEDVSEDEDESEVDIESLQSFINDQVEPTTATQQDVDDGIDMMAVYRRSLLTQSPLDGNLYPWMQFQRPNETPASANLGSLSSESRLSVSIISHERVGKRSGSSGCKTSGTDRSLSATPCVENITAYAVSSDPNEIEVEGKCSSEKVSGLLKRRSSTQSVPKFQDRKRKLSFQQEELSAAVRLPNVAGQFDDDVFTGIDLDALEVEAALKAHVNLHVNVSQSVVPMGLQKVKDETQIDEDLRRDEDDFHCIPSFNLGINC